MRKRGNRLSFAGTIAPKKIPGFWSTYFIFVMSQSSLIRTSLVILTSFPLDATHISGTEVYENEVHMQEYSLFITRIEEAMRSLRGSIESAEIREYGLHAANTI